MKYNIKVDAKNNTNEWTPSRVGALMTPILLTIVVMTFVLTNHPIPEWLITIITVSSGGGLYGIGHAVGNYNSISSIDTKEGSSQ